MKPPQQPNDDLGRVFADARGIVTDLMALHYYDVHGVGEFEPGHLRDLRCGRVPPGVPERGGPEELIDVMLERCERLQGTFPEYSLVFAGLFEPVAYGPFDGPSAHECTWQLAFNLVQACRAGHGGEFIASMIAELPLQTIDSRLKGEYARAQQSLAASTPQPPLPAEDPAEDPAEQCKPAKPPALISESGDAPEAEPELTGSPLTPRERTVLEFLRGLSPDPSGAPGARNGPAIARALSMASPRASRSTLSDEVCSLLDRVSGDGEIVELLPLAISDDQAQRICRVLVKRGLAARLRGRGYWAVVREEPT